MNEQNNNPINPISHKSRHQSHLEFFNALQLEFIQAEIRYKIYPRLKDKNFWKRVMDGKKETIDKFSEKNKIPSIFTDESMRREFESKVYRDQSYPLFTYKNEQNKQEQEFYDLRYYYYPGSEVRVLVLGETKIGKVSKEFIPYQHSYVIVTIDGVEDKYSISNVTRIL